VNVEQPLTQVHLLAPQSGQFRNPESVPVGEQDHGGVPVAMAAKASRSRDQSVDFRRCQVFPATPVGVGDLRGRVHGDFP
jgi:hypothetical protein